MDPRLKPFIAIGALLLAVWIAGMLWFGTAPAVPQKGPEPVDQAISAPAKSTKSDELPSARLREQAEMRAARDERSIAFGDGEDPAPADDAAGDAPDPN